MFEQFRLTEVLVQYKQNFVSKLWGEEKYKWEAVKWFQDNWDVNAPDFAEMLNRSLDKTYNLLASANNFPKGMIVGFAKSAPEEVRAMFLSLYDESKDVYERINAFKMRLFCWRSMETELHSTISTKMPSAHTFGFVFQTNTTSINSAK